MNEPFGGSGGIKPIFCRSCLSCISAIRLCFLSFFISLFVSFNGFRATWLCSKGACIGIGCCT